MIRRPNYVLWCIASLAFGLTSETAAAQGKVPDFYAVVKRQPLTFFVAKGSPNACGPGCSEWIAAEGMIDLDAAQRFRDFLGGLPRRDLPVSGTRPAETPDSRYCSARSCASTG